MSRKTLLAVASALIGLALSLPAGASGVPGPVVSAAWLKAHLGEVTILDVRDDMESFVVAPQFESGGKDGAKLVREVGGRIEGALPVDFSKIRTTKTINGQEFKAMLPDRAAFQQLMQSVGLNKGKPIVIASAGTSPDQVEQATRLYWSLKIYGQDDMALLDGGVASWLLAGYPVSTEKAQATTGDWEASPERRDLLAETADVEKAAKQHVQLVDARPLPQYVGLMYKKPTVKAGGHIAGARDYPPDLRTRAVDGAYLFLSPAEYRTAMRAVGVSDRDPSITYCNTGHLASGMWFVQHEILGNQKVQLYDGSMHEWTTLGKPVVGVDG